MRKKGVKDKILKATDGLLANLTDFVLFTSFHLIKSPNGTNMYKQIEISSQAYNDLCDFNYETIKKSLYNLKNKGLIASIRKPEITDRGKKRLKSLLPFYDNKRTWDGKLYLVLYDIPEKKRHIRNLLRDHLPKIGAALFQRSVWLTPYNPEKVLSQWAVEHNIKEKIRIACLQKGELLGRESLKDLVEEVYQLEELNDEYYQFIHKFKNVPKINKLELTINFLSILQNDPQIPWELLPDDWGGDQAYKLYQKLLNSQRERI